MNNIENVIKTINNPLTGKTLFDENRLIEYKETNGVLTVSYNRDGISPKDKRKIESDIVEKFASQFSIENIKVSTHSKDSADVFKNVDAPSKPQEEKAPAQLKVGHGAIGNKKKVPGVKNVIAIASGKGGVGKSTVTVNLALSLKRQGFKIGIIDADIYGPSIPMMLGSREAKPESNEDKKIIPISKEGISFISFGLFIEEKDAVIWRGPMLGGVLNQFLFDVKWDDLDYLLIDLPPGTGDVQLSMTQNTHVDGVVIVSTPQDIALLDAFKAYSMFEKMNIPVIGVIENMSSFICDNCDEEHFIFGNSGAEKKTSEMGINFLGKIPLETAMRECADKGTPYMSVESNSKNKGFESYTKISQLISSKFSKEENVESGKPGFFSKFLR